MMSPNRTYTFQCHVEAIPSLLFRGKFRPENRRRLPAIVLSTTAATARTLHRFGFIVRERAATPVRTMKRRDGGLRLSI